MIRNFVAAASDSEGPSPPAPHPETGRGEIKDSIDPELVKIFAAKTESERLRIAWGMWRSARRMIERIVAAEHPELSSEDRSRIVAQRMSHGT